MEEEEFDKLWPEICVRVEGVHDQKELEKFINQEMNKELDLYRVTPAKWFLVPDYSEKESLMFIIAHHSFIDGVQGWSLLQAMTVEKDFSGLPRVSPPTFL